MNILLIEDNLAEARLFQEFLSKIPKRQFDIFHVQCLQSGLKTLLEKEFDIILLDLSLPDSQGLDSLEPLIRVAPNLPIVVLTNTNDDQLALEAVRRGAQDYLVKGMVNVELLSRSIYYAIERKQNQANLREANQELAKTNQLLIQEIREKQKIAQELQRSNAELEQFAYIVSHDLKQPLSTISAWTQMLQLRYKQKLDEKGEKYLKMIINGTQQMDNLIQDLLEYSRVSRKTKELQLVSVEDVITMAKARLEKTIKDTRAEIIYQSLPTVMADPVQLTQVFQNLIENGIKYHSAEPPRIEIAAVFHQKETNFSEWLFSVTDNGIGIEAKFFQRIFQIFQRLHTANEYPGSGIGLAICQKIVEGYGGRIWVESELKKGSTFYFTLPVSKPD